MCCCRGSLNSLFADELLTSALATLPVTDQQQVCAAELEINKWRSHMHSYPGDTTNQYVKVGGILQELRLAFHSAAFSQVAHSVMVQHLCGELPLEEWDPLLQVQCLTRHVCLIRNERSLVHQHQCLTASLAASLCWAKPCNA